MQVIKRSVGRNAVACISYRAAIAMFDQRTGMHFDFSKSNKEVIGYSAIMAPEATPPMLLDRETLWQNVELMEKRKDAQLCREFDAALPIELTKEQQIALMRDFCQSSLVDCGMICDINMHDKPDNPHFHTMMTMRDIDPNAEYGFGKKNRKWNRKDLTDIWRHNFADCINKHLKLAGSPVRYSCETLEKRGIDRIAQIHVGSAAIAMDERGEQSWRVEANNEIIDFNQASAKIKARKAEAEKVRAEEKAREEIETAHALALEMEAERVRATQYYLHLIAGMDKKLDARETWRNWKPVAEVHRPEWRQIGLSIGKAIRGIIRSIRKLTADYLDIYGRDVKQDAAVIGGDAMSGGSATHSPDDLVDISDYNFL